MESLLKDRTTQDSPIGYDYNNEQDRFGDIACIWNQTYEPGSPEWLEYLEHQKANHVTFDPTFNIYAASRDLMRARNADWNDTYTMPQLWNYFQSTRDNHGSYFYDWTTENEYQWKMFYQRYMRLINATPDLPDPRGRGRYRTPDGADGGHQGRTRDCYRKLRGEGRAHSGRRRQRRHRLLHPDFVAEVKRLTDGKGVDVVYDGVGQATLLKGLDCLRPRGMMVLFGNASGAAPAFDPLMLSAKGSLYLTRPATPGRPLPALDLPRQGA